MPRAVSAQTDPGRVFVIEKASIVSEMTLKAQLEMQKLQTVGHIWTRTGIHVQNTQEWKS